MEKNYLKIILTFIFFIVYNKALKDELPLYLSVEADNDMSKNDVFNFALNSLEKLMSLYTTDERIKADYL